MGISILFIPLSVILCQGVTYGTVTLTFHKLFEKKVYVNKQGVILRLSEYFGRRIIGIEGLSLVDI